MFIMPLRSDVRLLGVPTDEPLYSNIHKILRVATSAKHGTEILIFIYLRVYHTSSFLLLIF
jgi:hypothetical protein